MARDEEGFLGRWSRRKDEARKRGEEAPAPTDADTGPKQAPLPPSAPPPAADAGTEGDAGKRQPIDLAKLPPLDSLNAESDYSLFMREGVPEDLRRQALRKLWASDPVLSAPDLLDIHAIDYNAVPTFPEGIRSLFRAGLGMIDSEPQPDPSRPPPAPVEAAEPAPTPVPDAPTPAVEKSPVGEPHVQIAEAEGAPADDPPAPPEGKSS